MTCSVVRRGKVILAWCGVVKALRHDVVWSGVSVCVRRVLALTNRTVHASRLTVAHMGVFSDFVSVSSKVCLLFCACYFEEDSKNISNTQSHRTRPSWKNMN